MLPAEWSQLREQDENLSSGRVALVQRLAEADKRGALALVQRTLSVLCDYFGHVCVTLEQGEPELESKVRWLMLATIFVYGEVPGSRGRVNIADVEAKLAKAVSDDCC